MTLRDERCDLRVDINDFVLLIRFSKQVTQGNVPTYFGCCVI